MTTTNITLMVHSDDEAVIGRTVEHFTRAAAGLALDGVRATLMFGPDEDDDGAE